MPLRTAYHMPYVPEGRFSSRNDVDAQEIQQGDNQVIDDIKHRSGRKICCIAAIVNILIIFAIAAVTIPMIVVKWIDTDKETSFSIEGEFRINEETHFPYRPELADPTSSTFRQYEENICDELTSEMIISSYENVQCDVLEFRNGSLIVRFRVEVIDPNIRKNEVDTMRSQLVNHIVRRISDSNGIITHVRGEDITIDEAQFNICETHPCLNGGSCNLDDESGSFTCICASNFKGRYCATEKDCIENPCQNGGVCQEIYEDSMRYNCSCPTEYSGINCEQGVPVLEIIGVVVMDDPESVDICSILPQVQTLHVQCEIMGVYPLGSRSSIRFSATVLQHPVVYTSRERIVDSYRTAIFNAAPNSKVYFMGEDCATSECTFECIMEAGQPRCVCAPGYFLHEDDMHCLSMSIIIFPNHTASGVIAGNEFRLQCILLADNGINPDLVTLKWMRRNPVTRQNERVENDLRVFVIDYEQDAGWKKSVLYFWTVEQNDTNRYTCLAEYQEAGLEQYVDMTVSDCEEGFVRCESQQVLRPSSDPHNMPVMSDLQCIPEIYVCDGVANCISSSDEYGCEDTCTDGNNLFFCSSGLCIPLEYRCDGKDDCGDGGSDEQRCLDDCQGGFTCPLTRECMPLHLLCNGNCDCYRDVDVGEICFDELFNAMGGSCTCRNSSQVKCPNTGECIYRSDLCDRYRDCSDAWDERNCSYTCNPYQFRCASGYCVQSYFECNGENNCGDWSDELHCGCSTNQWRCPESGQCIDKLYFCDGKTDCNYGEDEAHGCSQHCQEGQFSCGMNCINASRVCDGIEDCSGGSDERRDDCDCTEGKFRCRNYQCINIDEFCDGWVQCTDSSDEPENCFLLLCPPGHIECATKSGDNCLPTEKICDGVVDCVETGEDELTANCGCNADRFNCSGVCVSGYSWCDGYPDCIDGSDEYPIANCSNCPQNALRCSVSGSISCYFSNQVCDGALDCPRPTASSGIYGWDDERNCTCDLNTEIQCDMDMCISRILWCDGVSHCPDGSDERIDCQCLDDAQLTCSSGQCVPRQKACDGVYDCSDGSDESTLFCPCPERFFRCSDGSDCILSEYVCNERMDCNDRSDEIGCPCRGSQISCDSGLCINEYNWCDGLIDCDDGSDENRLTCGDSINGCPTTRYACYNEITLFECRSRSSTRCDGDAECLLGHDEVNCNRTCSSSQYQCHWGLCLYSNRRCNGVNDCFDWTDEVNCKEACYPFEIRCNASRATNGRPGDFYCIPQQYACDHVTDCFEGEDEVFDENGECLVNILTRCGDGAIPINISNPDYQEVFASPMYPSNFNNEECVWRLQASVDHVIRIVISDLYFSYGTGALTVIDSDERHLLSISRSNYNSFQNATFLSRGDSLQFILNYAGSGRFLVLYSQIHQDAAIREPFPQPTAPANQGCGGEIYAGTGIITSPNFPQPYDHNLRCSWTIRPEIPGQGIQIHVTNFDTETCCDYLLISANNDVLDTLEGYVSPKTYETSHGYMSLYFYTDHSVTSTGFSLRYSAYAAGTTLSPTMVPTTVSSCVGHCGSYSEGRVCYCDDQCLFYGDCCEDLDDVCHTTSRTTPYTTTTGSQVTSSGRKKRGVDNEMPSAKGKHEEDSHKNQTKQKFQLDIDPHVAPNCNNSGRGFLCGSGECIYYYQRCDGIRDCADRSDEIICYCDPGEYKCVSDNNCVYRTFVCDGVADCDDHSDEWECACGDGGLYCESEGLCLPQSWVCDGEPDCQITDPDGEAIDENTEQCGTCADNEFQCHERRQCIETTRVCDGIVNCPDSSDEEGCISLEGVPSSQINSIVARRHDPDEWYFVCGDVIPQLTADAACRMMGFADVDLFHTIPLGSMNASERNLAAGIAILQSPIEQRNILFGAVYTSLTETMCNNVLTNVTCISHTCGIPSLPPKGEQGSNHVINGARADIRSWPWQVSLQDGDDHFCGGSIISERWIVTAAHCVEDIYFSFMRILVGTEDSLQSYNLYRINRVFMHPDYYETNRDDVGIYVNRNDIALIELTQSLVFSERIRPICLPDDLHTDSSFRECFVTGWGQTQPEPGYGGSPRYLQQGKLDVISTEQCRNTYNDNWFALFPYTLPYTPPIDERIHVCAGGQHTRSCYGDSGGPLSCQDYRGRWFLNGVVSHGTVPHCSHLEKYTRTAAYLDWINYVMNS